MYFVSLAALSLQHSIYITTVSSYLLLRSGTLVSFMAGLGQKPSVLCIQLSQMAHKLPYAPHYNPRFVYFLPNFEVHFCTVTFGLMFIQERFLIKSRLQWCAYISFNQFSKVDNRRKELTVLIHIVCGLQPRAKRWNEREKYARNFHPLLHSFCQAVSSLFLSSFEFPNPPWTQPFSYFLLWTLC